MIIIQQLKFNKFVILFKVKDENKEDKGELFGRYYTQKRQVVLFSGKHIQFLTNMLSNYLASTGSNDIIGTSGERLLALLIWNVLQCISILYMVDS